MTTPLDPDTAYRALLARDARFDGRFFVAVASTRIYCRPICPARPPRRQGCTFYPNAASAEAAGFRPCLRCRPELVPGNAHVDAVSDLAARAASRIEDGALLAGTLETLAAELGVSSRHLRRVVQREFGVSPVALAQTHRLLLAKRLLTDTTLPVTEVAYASGFASLRRFHALFRERYRLSPTALRREGATAAPPATLRATLAYRPPLDWAHLVDFLGARATRGVEHVEGDTYRRTVALGSHRGWIAVRPTPDRDTLTVELSASLAPVLPAVMARVKRLFDLGADPAAIAERLGPLAATRPGLRVPGAWEGAEVAVRVILGQQVSVRAATTLAGRLTEAFGEAIETPYPELTRIAPTTTRLAAAAPEELIALGITAARVRAIQTLTNAIANEGLRLMPGVDIAETMERLLALPGIGEWSAQAIAMRALAWPDAFPHTDLAIRRALDNASPQAILAHAEAWRPWRAYAALHLWARGE